MGVSGKWIKALVGLKKSEKSQSSVKDDNVGTLPSSNHLFILLNSAAFSHYIYMRISIMKMHVHSLL